MNADIAVVQILLASAPVTGMVAARIFPGDVPQTETYPVVMVEVFDAQPYDSKDGASVIDAEQVKVFCYADTVKQSAALGKAVRTALDDFSGSTANYTVQHIRYLRQDSQSLALTNRKAYLRELDFMVRINN